MPKFDIREYAERKGRATFAPIGPRLGSEIAYRRALRQVLRGLAKVVREDVIPAYRAEQSLVQDGPRDWFRALEAMQSRLEQTATATAARIMALEADRHTDAWQRAVKSTLGLDMSAIIRREDLNRTLEIAAERNAGLIKSFSADTVKRIEQAVLRNASQGGSVRNLREQLQNDLGVMESRARLIARDQVAKMNSDLNRERHEQAGITEYEWLTSQDERVRPDHAAANGRIFKYGEPTSVDSGAAPGEDIQCRCVARAIVEF